MQSWSTCFVTHMALIGVGASFGFPAEHSPFLHGLPSDYLHCLYFQKDHHIFPTAHHVMLCEIACVTFSMVFNAGFIAMHATLASRDVDCCLIPESPFYLDGPGGLYEYIEKRLKEQGHMVIVIAEGAGQELLSQSLQSTDQQDASGNKLLQDVGLWISQSIKVWLLMHGSELIICCI